MSDIQLFKGAGLPAADIAKYKQALTRVQASAPTIGGLPILKLGKDGIWRYGQTDTDVQDGSEWAVNPVSMKKGFIAWAALYGFHLIERSTHEIDAGRESIGAFAFSRVAA